MLSTTTLSPLRVSGLVRTMPRSGLDADGRAESTFTSAGSLGPVPWRRRLIAP